MSELERLLGHVANDMTKEPLKCVVCGSDDEVDLQIVDGVHMCSYCREELAE